MSKGNSRHNFSLKFWGGERESVQVQVRGSGMMHRIGAGVKGMSIPPVVSVTLGFVDAGSSCVCLGGLGKLCSDGQQTGCLGWGPRGQVGPGLSVSTQVLWRRERNQRVEWEDQKVPVPTVDGVKVSYLYEVGAVLGFVGESSLIAT